MNQLNVIKYDNKFSHLANYTCSQILMHAVIIKYTSHYILTVRKFLLICSQNILFIAFLNISIDIQSSI